MASGGDVLIRVRLAGEQAVTAGIGRVRRSLRTLGPAGRIAGVAGAAGLEGIRSKLLGVSSQATSTQSRIRSMVAGAGLGLLGAQVAKTGFGFNQLQARQRVAFTSLLGSGERAKRMMSDIQGLAKSSPTLDVANTGQGVQRMLAFGLSAKDALRAVSAIGDGAAVMSKSVEEAMGPAALAIGQIQSKGKLSAEEINQLSDSVGVGRGAIAKQLGMTGAQLEKSFTGKAISSARAVPAILAAIEKSAGGAGKAMSSETEGQLARLKDGWQQASGALTGPMYKQIGPIAARLGAALGGLPVDKIGAGLGSAFGAVAGLLGDVIKTLAPAAPLIKNVLAPFLGGVLKGAFSMIALVVKVALVPIGLLARLLGWLGEKAEPLAPIFEGIGKFVGGFLGGSIIGGAIKAIAWLAKGLKFLAPAAAWVSRIFGMLPGPVRTVASILGTVFLGPIFMVVRHFGTLVRVVRAVIRPFVAVGRAGAAGARALGSAAVRIGGFFLRMQMAGIRFGARVVTFLVRPFRAIGSKILGPLKSGFTAVWGFVSRMVGRAASLGGRVASALSRGIGRVKNMVVNLFKGGLGFAGDIANAMRTWLNDKTPLGDRVNLPKPLPDFTLPALATGGTMTRSGLALVGERGPEVVSLQRGQSVFPNYSGITQAAMGGRPGSARGLSGSARGDRTRGMAADGERIYRIELVNQLDGRVLSRSTADFTESQLIASGRAGQGRR